MNILTIIPARGGSKGIKRKNLARINGKPLVAYSIEHSLSSNLINRTIVSTEDAEIARVSKEYGAEIPVFRPRNLAEDHVLDWPVFEHILQYLKMEQNYTADIIVHLRPTAPIRDDRWVDEAIQLLIDNPEADSVRSVSQPDNHPYRVFCIDKQGYLEPVMKHEHPEPYLLRRQDLPPMYYYNCVIDITRSETILKKKSMTGDKLLPFIMSPDSVIDIDTPMDLKIAEYLIGEVL